MKINGLLVLIAGILLIAIGYLSIILILEMLPQPSPILSLPIFGSFLGVPVFLFLGVVISLFGYGLTMHQKRNKIPHTLLVSFLAYAIVVGLPSIFIGDREFYVFINPAGDEASSYTYNNLLIPYWKDNLEPTSYETIPIVDLETQEITGYEVNPVYDFPIESTRLLIFPLTLFVWGAIGCLGEMIWKVYEKRNQHGESSSNK